MLLFVYYDPRNDQRDANSTSKTLSPTMPLKLTIEWIPKSSAGKSLNMLLPKSRWDKVRTWVYREYENWCAICGEHRTVRRLHCHEEWEYDDDNHVQRLKGFVALCHLCHNAKHGILPPPPYPKYEPGAALNELLESHPQGREWPLNRLYHEEEFAKPYEERRRELFDAESYREELASRDEETRHWLQKLDLRKKPVEHFVEVNRPASLAKLEEHIWEAFETWRERSRHRWRVDFGKYGELFD